MKRWVLYHLLTVLDVLRLWPTVQHHVIIVAGICLPILLLLGLKNGHVADLRQELLKSPTGRQIVFWSGQHGELMTADTIRSFEQQLPGVDMVIPELQRLVAISAGNEKDGVRRLESVTLYSTKSGDPILRQYGVDVARAGGKGLVLVSHVAETLKVSPGDMATVTVERTRDNVTESASVVLKVAAVIERSGDEKSALGYADVETLAAMEQYVMGFQVRELGWSAWKVSAPDAYSSYLMFCEQGDPLTKEDLRTLAERGYAVQALTDPELRTLYSLLASESLTKLLVYRLNIENSPGQQSLTIAPGQLARLTEADDVVIPWNDPLVATMSGRPYRLLGFSLPQRTWLRLHLQQRDYGFDFDADTFSVQFVDPRQAPQAAQFETVKGSRISLAAIKLAGAAPGAPDNERVASPPLSVQNALPPAASQSSHAVLSSTQAAVVKDAPAPRSQAVLSPTEAAAKDTSGHKSQPVLSPTEAASTKDSPVQTSQAVFSPTEAAASHEPSAVEPAPRPPQDAPSAAITDAVSVAVVPMDLLAHLHAEAKGRVEYDAVNRLFVPLPTKTLFDKARLYADTIDNVPGVVDQLRQRRFAIMSEVTRIREIHQQGHSLHLLVLIVGIGVFLFGTGTVVSVLLDSTERKRGTIGILRVMGVSRLGVFYMIFLRSAIIGILAAGVTIGLGYTASLLLNWSPSMGNFWGKWKPVIHVLIQPNDILIVVAGALTCCMLGSLLPANKASGMDPFDAIVEGRFR